MVETPGTFFGDFEGGVGGNLLGFLEIDLGCPNRLEFLKWRRLVPEKVLYKI
jgi:hypothetical protein